MSEDEDEVAFEGDIEPESATGEAPGADDSGDDDDDTSFEGQANQAAPTLVRTPRGTRPISDKVREMFKSAAKQIAEQHKDDPDDDDEVIDYDEAPYGDKAKASTLAPAGTPVVPVGTPAGAPSTAPPAPTMDPQVTQLREQWSAKLADLDAREQAMVTSEKASDVARLRETYFERGAPAIVEILKKWTGLDGDDLRDEIADLVTDLSGQSLGVALPSEVKSRIESKRAQKAVRSFKADLAEREKAAETRAEQLREAEQRNRAITALGKEMAKPEIASQFQYLSAEDNAADLIFDVVEAQLKRDGTMLRWEEAARRADDYLNRKASAWFDKRKHLLSAAATKVAGEAKPGTEQAPRETNQGHRRSQAAPPTQAPPTPPPPVKNGKWDPEAHRRQTKQRMRAAFARQPDE